MRIAPASLMIFFWNYRIPLERMVRTSSFGVLAEIHVRDSSSRCKLTWPFILSLHEPILDKMQGNLWHFFFVWTGIPTNKLCQIAGNGKQRFLNAHFLPTTQKDLCICGGMDGLIIRHISASNWWIERMGERNPASGTFQQCLFSYPTNLCSLEMDEYLNGGFKYFWFHPYLRKSSNGTNIFFANRLVQPPTRYTYTSSRRGLVWLDPPKHTKTKHLSPLDL